MSNPDLSKQRNLSPDIELSTNIDPIERPRYDSSVRTGGPGGTRTPSVFNGSQLSARERKRRILNNQDPFEAEDGVSYQSLN